MKRQSQKSWPTDLRPISATDEVPKAHAKAQGRRTAKNGFEQEAAEAAEAFSFF
jgi:hypothetical protein